MLVSTLITILKGHRGEYNLQSMLKGVRVRVIYDRQKHDPNRDPNTEELHRKVINGIGSRPGRKFISATSSQTVAAYFTSLGYSIKDPKLECIDVGTRDQQIWIPPELLEIVDRRQQFHAPLSSQHTAKMIGTALRGPAENAQLIVKEALGNNLMGIKPRDLTVMNPLGISINEHMLQLPYTNSDIPRIEYGANGNNTFPEEPQAASWNLRDYHFYRSAGGPNKADGIQISRAMEHAFEAVGMNVSFDDSIAGECGYSEGNNYEHLLDEELSEWYGIGTTPYQTPKFLGPLLIVLNSQDKAVYAAIKRWADCHVGIQTVCAVYHNIVNKGGLQYFANLALKFNPKLGGINHRILVPKKQDDPPKSGPRKSDPRKSDPREFAFHAIKDTTIVMGADVVHPPTGGMPGCPSVAALVASEDSTFFSFPGSMRLNPAREEIIANLEDMVLERLRKYCDFNKGKLPSNILFYRDGVSEGQYYAVNKDEVLKIRAAWDKAREYVLETYPRVETKDRARIHFIVVQKRHHVRFYAGHEDQCTNPDRPDGNVKPGLLVNTRPKMPTSIFNLTRP
ncbi:Piwi domain-containing protein [Delphinella strobiligena]|nr:Piwi domain-containing protein [Delphinella strobiligena]